MLFLFIFKHYVSICIQNHPFLLLPEISRPNGVIFIKKYLKLFSLFIKGSLALLCRNIYGDNTFSIHLNTF